MWYALHQALYVICYSEVFLTYKRYAIRRNAKYQMPEMSQCIDLAVACHPRRPSTTVSICRRAIYRLPVQMCDIKANKRLGLKEDVRQTNQVRERREK